MKKKQTLFLVVSLIVVLILMYWSQTGKADANYTTVDYVVKKGDTLWAIASKNSPSNVNVWHYIEEVKSINNISSNLRVGQKIKILSFSNVNDNTETETFLGSFRITGYNPYCSHCCGKADGITASGKPATIGKTVAMQGVQFGTKIRIEGFEGVYVVEDRGGVGVDIACSSHNECYKVTRKSAKVWVIK